MPNFPRLRGMIAATFTPMTETGDINYAEIKPYADYIASTAIDGVFVNGTTGDSHPSPSKNARRYSNAGLPPLPDGSR